MNFGVPKKNKKKEEKYPETAVFTLNVEGKKGTAKTMVFNTMACEMLKLSDKKAGIAFSFDDGIKVMNADQKGIPDEHEIRVTKTTPRRISDKSTYEYIVELLGLDTSIENEFEVYDEAETNGITHFKIKPLEITVDDTVNQDVDFEEVSDDTSTKEDTLESQIEDDRPFDFNEVIDDNTSNV